MPIHIKVSEMLGRHKLSQRDLARGTGIHPYTISKLYHEKVSRLELSHLEKLCEFFQCQPGDLLEYLPDRRRG